jgi:hypothetical protein
MISHKSSKDFFFQVPKNKKNTHILANFKSSTAFLHPCWMNYEWMNDTQFVDDKLWAQTIVLWMNEWKRNKRSLNSLAHNLSATSAQISSHPTKLSKEGKTVIHPVSWVFGKKHVPEGLLMLTHMSPTGIA